MKVIWINYEYKDLRLFLKHFKKPINYKEIFPSVILKNEKTGLIYMIRNVGELSKYPLDAFTKHQLTKIFK